MLGTQSGLIQNPNYNPGWENGNKPYNPDYNDHSGDKVKKKSLYNLPSKQKYEHYTYIIYI